MGKGKNSFLTPSVCGITQSYKSLQEIRYRKFSCSIQIQYCVQNASMFIAYLDYRSTSTKELIFKLHFKCLDIKITLLSSHLVETPKCLRGITFPVPLSHHSLKLLSTDVPTAMVIGEFISTVSLKLSGRKKSPFLLRGWDTKKSFIISDCHFNKQFHDETSWLTTFFFLSFFGFVGFFKFLGIKLRGHWGFKYWLLDTHRFFFLVMIILFMCG